MKRWVVVLATIFFVAVLFFVARAFTGFVVAPERAAPSNYFSEADVSLIPDGALLSKDHLQFVRFSDTGSMLPLISEDSSGIVVAPEYYGEIQVGDIVGFELEGKTIVHRIVEKGVDEGGVYYVSRGDKAGVSSERFYEGDIRYVVVGILY